MSHLEELLVEYYEWLGHVVKCNVQVGKLSHGGYEMELDVVAYEPQANQLLHIEPSLDADSWEKREKRFVKKFQAGLKYIRPALFPWLPPNYAPEAAGDSGERLGGTADARRCRGHHRGRNDGRNPRGSAIARDHSEGCDPRALSAPPYDPIGRVRLLSRCAWSCLRSNRLTGTNLKSQFVTSRKLPADIERADCLGFDVTNSDIKLHEVASPMAKHHA